MPGGTGHGAIERTLVANGLESRMALPVDIPAFDVRQCWHERYHDDPRHRWRRQQFMELFGEQPSESRC
jgi:DNA-binding transcriptional LysR family regulator